MALRKIALEGEACLSKVCRPVTDFNSRLHTLLDDLADTLADSGGVGLAAPQVGVLRRVCVVLDEEDQLIELVNPEIIYTEGEQTGLEGCLSVPGKYGVVTRPEVVRVRAQDRDGQWFEVEDEGLTARCFCHEIEHLDGHLFVEHIDHFLTDEELKEYPCLSFEQGGNNSFYFAEEVLSTYEYKRLIKADDRATMLNLMVGLNGYTLCSGIICEDLNGSDYCAVKLDSDEIMTIGYVARKGVNISALGKKYLEEISRYKDKALK